MPYGFIEANEQMQQQPENRTSSVLTIGNAETIIV